LAFCDANNPPNGVEVSGAPELRNGFALAFCAVCKPLIAVVKGLAVGLLRLLTKPAATVLPGAVAAWYVCGACVAIFCCAVENHDGSVVVVVLEESKTLIIFFLSCAH
jgi:hypothetical protein